MAWTPPPSPQHPIHKEIFRPEYFYRSDKMLEKRAWPNLDAMSVPEALVYSVPVAQMLAAASIKVMDALFGFLVRNDAERCKRELLGRSWRRDRGAPKNGAQILGREKTTVKQNPGFARRTSTAQKISNQGWSKPGPCNFPILQGRVEIESGSRHVMMLRHVIIL